MAMTVKQKTKWRKKGYHIGICGREFVGKENEKSCKVVAF